MLVRVDVVERQAGRAEGLELRVDLCAELPPHAGLQRKSQRRARARSLRRSPLRSTRSGCARGGSRVAIDQDDMQPDAQARQPARARRPRRSAAAPATMRLAAVRMPRRCASSTASLTSRAEAEIVGRDDQSCFSAPAPGARAGSGRTRRLRAAAASSSRGLRHHLADDRGDLAARGSRSACRSPRPTGRSRCASRCG